MSPRSQESLNQTNQQVSIFESHAKGVTQASPLVRSEIDTGRYASMDKIGCENKLLSSPLDMEQLGSIDMIGTIPHLHRKSEKRLEAPLVTGVLGVVVPFEFVAGADVVFDASPGKTSP